MADKFVVGKYYFNNNEVISIVKCAFVLSDGSGVLTFVKKHPSSKYRDFLVRKNPIVSMVPSCWDEYVPPLVTRKGWVFSYTPNSGFRNSGFRNTGSTVFSSQKDAEQMARSLWHNKDNFQKRNVQYHEIEWTEPGFINDDNDEDFE